MSSTSAEPPGDVLHPRQFLNIVSYKIDLFLDLQAKIPSCPHFHLFHREQHPQFSMPAIPFSPGGPTSVHAISVPVAGSEARGCLTPLLLQHCSQQILAVDLQRDLKSHHSHHACTPASSRLPHHRHTELREGGDFAWFDRRCILSSGNGAWHCRSAQKLCNE